MLSGKYTAGPAAVGNQGFSPVRLPHGNVMILAAARPQSFPNGFALMLDRPHRVSPTGMHSAIAA